MVEIKARGHRQSWATSRTRNAEIGRQGRSETTVVVKVASTDARTGIALDKPSEPTSTTLSLQFRDMPGGPDLTVVRRRDSWCSTPSTRPRASWMRSTVLSPSPLLVVQTPRDTL